MNLSSEIRRTLKVGGESFTSILKRPSNEDLNRFFSERFNSSSLSKEEEQAKTISDRVAFYDAHLIGVLDLEADGKPVTVEQKGIIPDAWKSMIIFSAFEDVRVSEKN